MSSAIDIVSVDDAQLYLTNTIDPSKIEVSKLEELVTSVSEMFDDLCGPVVSRTVTEKLNGGTWYIRPSMYPIVSVTSLVEYASTTPTTLTEETNSSKPAAAYKIDGSRILRRSGNNDACFPEGRGNIEITYVAGRGAVTAIPSRFKEAAKITIQAIWVREQGHGSVSFGDVPLVGATFALPNAALEMLRKDIQRAGAISGL
jgi:hypothetical protein